MPGLFAGGQLDVMTAFLLRRLPVPPAGTRLLDFACGSGSIAAALVARGDARDEAQACTRADGSKANARRGGAASSAGGAGALGGGRTHSHERRVSCTLLDADAFALKVAKRNVPSAEHVLCSDRFRALRASGIGARSYDWIVSNPPVHATNGVEQDFRVLRSLIKRAPRWLKPGGLLLIVTQQYVPCGLLLSARGAYDRLDAAYSEDGRFVVWRARACGTESAAAPRAAGAAPAPAAAGLVARWPPKAKGEEAAAQVASGGLAAEAFESSSLSRKRRLQSPLA
jgi:16S rRNA (guanine1207-N2)-methyltransferase